MKKLLVNAILSSSIVITLVGCGGNSNSIPSNTPLMATKESKSITPPTVDPTIKAEDKNTVKTDAPKYKPEIDSITKSGGIGDLYSKLNKLYGVPNRATMPYNDGFGMVNYKNDFMLVNYKDGRVQSISFQLDVNNQKKSIAQALEFAKEYYPADAKQIKKYEVDEMDQVYILQSKTLSELFNPEVFSDNGGEDEPHLGEFYVRLAHDKDSVGAVFVTIGEPPRPLK